MKSLLLLGAMLIAHSALAERIERETPASARGEVQIVNVSGEVHVIGWDQSQVKLVGDAQRGVDEVEFERDGDVTRIRVRGTQGDAPRSTLTVQVPRESTLVIRTVSASQRIENVLGEQRLQSVSGAIHTSIGAEDLEAKTVSGEIKVVGNGKPGSTRVTTVSGEIRMEKVAGEFELSSVSGSIELSAGMLEEARVNTTNGEIQIRGELAADGRIEAEAINGSIDVNLTGKVATQFDIESFNGSINNCFGPKPRRAREHGPGIVLRFSEGDDPQARVRLKTLNGEIQLCRK
jgi:DUF4097 and DUF4098 domain-containing protein YvlB